MTISLKFVKTCLLVLVSLLFTMNGGSVLLSQTAVQRDAMSSSIEVIAHTDRAKYSIADSIKISASLENRGSAPVYIDRRMFWTGLSGGLKLDIVDEHGKHLPARFLSDAMMPPPHEGDLSILVRLDSGFFYGTSVNLIAKDFFAKPGRYSIRIIYKSWLHKDSVAPELRALPALWEDTPQIPSEPVWIDITQ